MPNSLLTAYPSFLFASSFSVSCLLHCAPLVSFKLSFLSRDRLWSYNKFGRFFACFSCLYLPYIWPLTVSCAKILLIMFGFVTKVKCSVFSIAGVVCQLIFVTASVITFCRLGHFLCTILYIGCFLSTICCIANCHTRLRALNGVRTSLTFWLNTIQGVRKGSDTLEQ